MKKILVLIAALSMMACKKEEKKPPADPGAATHSLTVTNGGSGTFSLFINNVEQPKGATSFTVKAGDVIFAVDKGHDTTLLNPDGTIKGYNQGYVDVVVFVDNVEKYRQQCSCDASFNYTI